MSENQAEGQVEMQVHEAGAHAAYANFARVTATPEEVIVDFALNPNPFAQGKQEIHVNNRLIMNFYTAKRLLSALAMTIQRHERPLAPSSSTSASASPFPCHPPSNRGRRNFAFPPARAAGGGLFFTAW